jgi:hypothetical protein
MLMVLLGAGIALLLVGLGALGYGIPYKEFGFGNTLIIAGSGAVCSGFMMIGFWAVARELQHISQRLGSGTAATAQAAFPAEPSLAPAFTPPPPPRAATEAASADPGAAPPWVEGRDDEPPPPPPAEAAPAPKPRRNLLFTSTSRKERERAAARASEPLAPDLLSADLRPNPPAMDAPPVEPMVPMAPSPPTFEDAWPKSERGRRTGRNAAPDVAPPPPARADAPQVTVLKSGVVDGMAYSLYSDGSIEAQMPEGMMRFASIDELRAHLDHRP